MSFNITIDNGTDKKAGNLSSNRITAENDKSSNSLPLLKKGQQITGVVVSVDDQVTLDFSGQKIKASKDVLSNAKAGDVDTFEVVKVNTNEIELKVLDDQSGNQQKTFMASMITDTDWDSIRTRTEKNAKQTEKESQYQDTKSKLDDIGSRMTQQDCRQIEDDGFPVETYSINGLYEALNRVKSGSSQTEVNAEQMTSFGESALAMRLEQENIPVTTDNLAKLCKALELSKSVENMDDNAIKYMISTGAIPSAQNIYKATYSGNAQRSAGNNALSEEAWSELENQVKDVIKSSGYEVNDENLMDARWLIENNLPLTADTFSDKKDLEKIQSDTDQDEILNRMVEGMKNGINPQDVSLVSPQGASCEQITADINSISDEAITQAVKEGSDLTIKKLVTIQESLAAEEETGEVNTDDSVITSEQTDSETDGEGTETASGTTENAYEAIKAKRQLEEIRLKMTLEAAGQLSKKGFSIETEQLSKVVDELKKLEDTYYQNLLKEADADVTDLSVQTLKDTTQGIEKLKYMPCSVLGKTLSERNSQTITGLLSEGSKLQAEYAKAGEAYETMATVPSGEYGDSIKKAFANADSLLSEMNLDNSDENNRAVRILGYNQMEINEASINQVKAYDQQVTDLMQNLQPSVTVRMIKEGRNPLNIPVSELNDTIYQIKEEQGITSEDKYSTYLHNLEKTDGITSEERKAYIGIYRLLYNIDKSDGSALGSVIKAGREVTLGNLLTAVQTSKKGTIDAAVNDDYGTLQSISHDNITIAEQLSSFSSGEGQQNAAEENSGSDTAEQTQYMNGILKKLKDELSPEALKETGSSLSKAASQSVASTAAPLLSSEQGIWETIKDVPAQELLNELQDAQTAQTNDDAAYTDKVQQIRDLCRNSEQAVRFLNDYQVPATPLNIMMTNHILSNGESPIKKILKMKSDNSDENSENGLKETNDLSDKLINKNSMQEAYEQLDTDAKSALVQACQGEKIDSRTLAELKSMGQQMTFIRTLAQKECYQIPIETDRGITNINLTILRGTQTSGKVTVSVGSEQLGNIKAEFTLKDQALKGYFSSDSREGLEQLQKSTAEIESAAGENNVTIKQMDFGLRGENDSYSYLNSDNSGDGSVSNDTERILYRIARAVVQTVRTAENNGLDFDRAVS